MGSMKANMAITEVGVTAVHGEEDMAVHGVEVGDTVVHGVAAMAGEVHGVVVVGAVNGVVAGQRNTMMLILMLNLVIKQEVKLRVWAHVTICMYHNK
jgi:hypothetical protein